MRSFKKFGMLAVVALALSAFGAANASAEFTASATGSLTGSALANQVFTTNGGTVTCKKAATSGTIASTAASEQEVTVKYGECTAFGFVGVHISDATYLFTTDGSVHIEDPITITVTKTLFTAHCTITVPEQTVESVDFATNGNNVKVTPTVEGIDYTSTGGVCGSSGTNGTYTGANEVSRDGGGWVAFDN